MEHLTQLFIHTPWRQAHKWDINGDGLVEYNDELLSPVEVYHRFLVDYPMFNVLRAEVYQRIITPNGPKDYNWVTVELFRGR